MWRHHLKIGLRTLLKNRTYAFINLAGLTIGLAACLMILLYVLYERSFDDWLPQAERTDHSHDRHGPCLPWKPTDARSCRIAGIPQRPFVHAGTASGRPCGKLVPWRTNMTSMSREARRQ